MKHLTLLLILTACSSKPYMKRQPQQEVKTYEDAIRCQVELLSQTERNLDEISEFRVYKRSQISRMVTSLKHELLQCTRIKSDFERNLEEVAIKPSLME